MSSKGQKDLCELTATEVVPLLRSGDIKVTDPIQVLQEAQKLDDLPAAQRGPLHGLPVAVKDIILTKDMPTQYNSPLLESQVPIGADANCILSLRAAGALIFGKTTTTEFATSKIGKWHQNLTGNIHDPKRTPGGSSSGSGAAVADFQVPVALGTQTGGSIIRPASFNHCYGLKPTWGTISKEGISGWTPTVDTFGFFTRSVNDLDLLLDLYHIYDDEAVPKEPFKLQGAKIGFCKTPYWPNAGQGTRNAMDRAKKILKSHGANVEDVDLPKDFEDILSWHAALLAREGQASFLGQYLTGKNRIHEKNIIDYVENGKGFSRADQLRAYDNCARLRPAFDEIARQYSAIITPSVVDEAPLGSETGDMNFCSIWTALHTPALNIPGFASENGLPIGLTVVGPRFTDRHLLHLAKAIGPLFEEHGGWVRPENLPARRPPRRQSTGYRST